MTHDEMRGELFSNQKEVEKIPRLMNQNYRSPNRPRNCDIISIQCFANYNTRSSTKNTLEFTVKTSPDACYIHINLEFASLQYVEQFNFREEDERAKEKNTVEHSCRITRENSPALAA